MIETNFFSSFVVGIEPRSYVLSTGSTIENTCPAPIETLLNLGRFQSVLWVLFYFIGYWYFFKHRCSCNAIQIKHLNF